jgi:hypothetical protein
VNLGMMGKCDPAFLAEWLFLFPVWYCFIHAQSAKFPNLPGSGDTDGNIFLNWLLDLDLCLLS